MDLWSSIPSLLRPSLRGSLIIALRWRVTSIRKWRRRALNVMLVCLVSNAKQTSLTTDPVPPVELIQQVGGQAEADYRAVGQEFFDIFVRYGGIKPTDRVLDVGCGCGRMAWALTRFLTSGTFEGFDITPEAIEWCQRNITSQFPHFRFQLADLHNAAYNPHAKGQARDYHFPYPDRSFDFTFLTSVFTHMLPQDLEHYAREITRTLKPRGRAVITFFILNDESERLLKEDQGRLSFQHSYAGGQVRVQDLSNPEAAIAYPEVTVRRILGESGLKLLHPIYFGSWCRRTATVTHQDLTIWERKSELRRLLSGIQVWATSRFFGKAGWRHKPLLVNEDGEKPERPATGEPPRQIRSGS
jgi:SAM-dependent methyltransferase